MAQMVLEGFRVSGLPQPKKQNAALSLAAKNRELEAKDLGDPEGESAVFGEKKIID